MHRHVLSHLAAVFVAQLLRHVRKLGIIWQCGSQTPRFLQDNRLVADADAQVGRWQVGTTTVLEGS